MSHQQLSKYKLLAHRCRCRKRLYQDAVDQESPNQRLHLSYNLYRLPGRMNMSKHEHNQPQLHRVKQHHRRYYQLGYHRQPG